MFSRPLLFLSMGVALLGAKTPDFFQQCVTESGGTARYGRIETVAWSFSLARPGQENVNIWRGTQRIKRAGPVYFIREELETDDGRWSVWAGSVPRVERNGVLVTDPAVQQARVDDVKRRAYWVMAPFPLVEQVAGAEYLGSAYFHTRLVRRLGVKERDAMPFAGPVVLQLDSDGARLRGVVYGSGETQESLLLDEHEPRQNLLTTPGRWTRYNAAGKRVEVLRLTEIVFNSFIDESIFSSPADAQQGDSAP